MPEIEEEEGEERAESEENTENGEERVHEVDPWDPIEGGSDMTLLEAIHNSLSGVLMLVMVIVVDIYLLCC